MKPWQLNPEAAETDIRIRWESARLQQVTALLVYASLFPEDHDRHRGKQAAVDIILDWLEANPFLQGENYLSAMECALRIPVFFFALKRLDRLPPEKYDRIMAAVYQHGLLISGCLSLYSSVGNHTVAEATGLVFAGAIYDMTATGRRWLETGIRLLSKELPHQILSDGGPAEQSLNYHRFVLDLYWLAMDFILKNGLGDVASWKSRLILGEAFLSAFKNYDGELPGIGDSDDGVALARGVIPVRDGGAPIKVGVTRFAHAGYGIVRDADFVFTFDNGPLGMAPLYNHGHADALSVTLSVKGKPLLVDSGTYRYNGVPEWRKYFKGTRAHNTVIIDDRDQAVQETDFIWSRPYKAEMTALIEKDGHLFLSATHDGYMRLGNPVRHRRSVLHVDRENFLIRDGFSGTGVHQFQLNFHFHPDADVFKEDKWWIADHNGARIYLSLLDGHFQLVQGSRDPIMGWFSDRYGRKRPTCVLTASKTGRPAGTRFTTLVKVPEK